MPTLTRAQLDAFLTDGYVRIDHAFPTVLADACRARLWADLGCDPDDPRTWTRPVVRLGHYAEPPFREAANTPRLHDAFDALVGRGAWLPQGGLGTFPVRFPSPDDPGDTGWHVDPSFGFEEAPADFLAWRTNLASRGRALLMLFLLSEIGPDDAPTRLRAGSHLDVARRLAPAGDAGLSLRELVATGFAESAHRPEVLVTGEPGTVYLCHPFVVHAAQPHRGRSPRFLAQPPLLPAPGVARDPSAPVERAIRLALERPDL